MATPSFHKEPIVTEDELGEQFESHRRTTVRFAAWRFKSVDQDTIDMLYTDCWASLMAATFNIGSLKIYLEKSLANRIKDYLRNRMSSQDLMDRAHWMQPTREHLDSHPSSEDNLADQYYVNNLADLRPHDAEALEAVCSRVNRALDKVPATLAIVGQWYYVDELGLAGIAKRLDCTHQYVSILLARFRRHFSQQYHRLCNLEE